MTDTLTSRREFLFCYDIRMGNPNGDPDENRPRILPDGTYYVSDVRLKRFVRDYLKMQGNDLLVDNIEGRTTNLTGRVGAYLKERGKAEADGDELVDIILESFIDARLFGSSLAFKKEESKDAGQKPRDWNPSPKTLTGATQITQGEVLHPAQEVDMRGTSIFSSAQEKRQGTFTDYFALRYALIGFNGISNEHSARLSKFKDNEYTMLLESLWNGVRSAGNTRSKAGQCPRLLISIVYKPDSEFQFGTLLNYITLQSSNGTEATEWCGPDDYNVDLTQLEERLGQYARHIDSIEYCVHPDVQFTNGNSRELDPFASSSSLHGIRTRNLDFDRLVS